MIIVYLFFSSAIKPINALQSARYSSEADRQYLLFIPGSYNPKGTKKWPLILHLHGLGVTGNQVENIRMEALPQMVDQNSDFGAFVLSPLLSGEGSEDYWTRDVPVNSINILLNEIQSN